MNIHSKARSCPASRALLVGRVKREAWKVTEAAAAAGVSRRTAYKWLRRHREEGPGGLRDRLSRPLHQTSATPEEWRKLILALRHYRLTAAQIAARLGMARSTVARILLRERVGRLKQLQPPQPIVRYEMRVPGQLLHLDVKKLGRIKGIGHRISGDRRQRARGVGWEYVHVAIDDASRLAYVEVLRAETAEAATGFLLRAVAFYQRHAVRIRRLMTDNAKAWDGHLFQAACQRYRIAHTKTKPYRPCTNGKAERFIQTLLREWAYVRAYSSSRRRTEALPRWLRYYNHRRPHGSLDSRPPISRLNPSGEQRA
jgi:transposase InsO family protein